jgi:hypothetical protein
MKWCQQYAKLVEFQRKTGHCIVPFRYKQDKSLGRWVGQQRSLYSPNKLQPGRKNLLDKLDFVWNLEIADNNEKKWHQQYKKLVEFKRKNGHCVVPARSDQDKVLGNWVGKQRSFHRRKEMRPDRKDLLDELEFDWKADPLAARSSTINDVRGLVIGSFCTWVRSFFSLAFFLYLTCVSRNLNLSQNR